MKKPTRSSPYEDSPDPMRDLDIELDSQNDEIIDLEDIIEMPDRPIDEDEDLDLDVEILDVDSDFETEPQEPVIRAQQPAKDEDLMESFGAISEDDETMFEQVVSKETAKRTVGRAEPEVFEEEDEESILDELLDERGMSESGPVEQKSADLRDRAAAAIKVPEETRPVEAEAEPLISESLETGPASIPPSADLSKTAEELIGRIESRLQEHIQVMVESILPDLVRSIISEEIEKLKKELP